MLPGCALPDFIWALSLLSAKLYNNTESRCMVCVKICFENSIKKEAIVDFYR